MAKGTVAKNNAIKAEKTNQVKEAEPKTNEKASDVLQAARDTAAAAKTAVKESASEVKAAVTEKATVVKAAVEKTAAKAEESKAETIKAEPAKAVAAETKETVKPVKEKKPSRAAKKAAAKAAAKEELIPEVFIQYQGNEAIVADVIEKAKNEFVADGHRASSIKSLQVYLKPEEFAAYYVINQKFAGRVDLF